MPAAAPVADKADDDLFDDISDDSEAEAKPEEKPEEAAEDDGEVNPENEKELIRDLIAEMAEMGVVVPDSVTDCKDFCQHLATAIKTHKATKQSMAGDQTATAESGEPAQEEAPMMMSLVKHFDPAVRAMAELTTTSEKGSRLKRLKRVYKRGILKPEVARRLRSEVEGWNLSLNRLGKLSPSPIDRILDVLEQIPAEVNLSGVRAVPSPLRGGKAEMEEIADRLTSGPETVKKAARTEEVDPFA